VRWIDLHPSANPSELGETEGLGEVGDADVLGAALAARRAGLQATEQAHRAAAQSWETTASSTLAGALRKRANSAHRQRAETYRAKSQLLEKILTYAPADSCTLSTETLAALTTEGNLLTDAFPTAKRSVSDALRTASDLPDGEPGISRPALPTRVGLIAGPQLEAGLSQTADITKLGDENYMEQLGHLDLVIIGSETSESVNLLLDSILPACRELAIPTVFFSTAARDDVEDTLSLAQACDWIFTVDATTIDTYLQLGIAPGVLKTTRFPVSPGLHNPVGTRPSRTDLVAFFGIDQARTSARLPMEEAINPLFDGVLGSARPVVLFQPEAGPHAAQWTLPRDYAPWTLSARESQKFSALVELPTLQRICDVGVAVNAVLDSQTLLDSRILQLQASGTMVLTSYNQGVNSYFPNVYIANSADDVSKTLQHLAQDELRKVQGDGIRKMFLEHHGTDVLSEILASIGLGTYEHAERVLVVADEITAELSADLAAQTYGVLDVTTWSELPQWANSSESSRGGFDVLLPVSATRRYSPFYAADHVAAFRYQGAPVTTKLQGTVEETDHAAHQHRSSVEDLSLSAWWRPRPETLKSPEALRASASRVYAIDHFGHRQVSARRTIDPALGSDFSKAEKEFRATAEAEGLELAVVVPIYNNGDHLRHKAFASLRRSEMFERMHILLINDGSTDASTIDTIEELAHAYPNVSAFHHAAGGSGSASRPRNTGLALSFTEFVTYLDPDDEELDDGYLVLLDALRDRPAADFSLGTMAVWTHRYSVHDYHSWFVDGVENQDGLVWPHRDTLKILNFRPASIEALVARTEWLKSLGLVQPVGAVGQDSYFFQQMIFYATAYVPVYRPVYTYYGAVDTSIMNVVSPKYFRKYLILETARAEWLRREGLLDDYMEQRFETFFVNWYLAKFDKVRAEDQEESARILYQIAEAYGPFQWTHPRAKAFFAKHQKRDSLQSQ